MVSEVIVFAIIFGVIFGIAYLLITSRHKERLSLIEKGAEASIFHNKNRKAAPIGKLIVVNIAFLAIFIGLAIFIASILDYNFNIDSDIAYPGTIFLMGGLGLLAGYFANKKLNSEV